VCTLGERFCFIFTDYHSTNGPLPVSGPASEIRELHQMFLNSARELKYKTIDCNGKEQIGKIMFSRKTYQKLIFENFISYTGKRKEKVIQN
jgi:hypothetical protein